MADYTSSGIQKQQNEKADNIKKFAKGGDYGAAARDEENFVSRSSGRADLALDSAVNDYVQRNPNKVSANQRTAPYGATLNDVVRTTMRHNPRTGENK